MSSQSQQKQSSNNNNDNINNSKNNNNRNTENSEINNIINILHTNFKISKTHINVGFSNLLSCNNSYKSLIINKRLPDDGWDDIQIQNFIFLLSTLDTNNKFTTTTSSSSTPRWCGVGEREGRIYSNLIQSRHYGLSHGIGRSGDISEVQPKAVGSSIIAKLTLVMLLDVLRRGLPVTNLNGPSSKNHIPNGPASYGIILPMCTGMSMSLVLSSLKRQNSDLSKDRNIVLWCRIDQKSCFKAIQSAGLEVVVIPTKLSDDDNDDSVVTDLEVLEEKLKEYEGQVLAVISTTSCFAPRIPDPIDKIAKLLADPTKSYCSNTVYHVVNNAYGIQCPTICKLLNRACTIGKVDVIVCSTDKNFLVPIGGGIILSPSSQIITNISKIYPGRASISPILDLFITLLSMGINGFRDIQKQRLNLLDEFQEKLEGVAKKYNEKLLNCKTNTISYGITLNNLIISADNENDSNNEDNNNNNKEISYFGSMLFKRCISGTRIITMGEKKIMGDNIQFDGFGSSTDRYPYPYMTAACSIGLSKNEMNEFFIRLDKCFNEYHRKQMKKKKDNMKKKKDQNETTT